MSQLRNLEGVFAVDKPPGITSADVLRDLQKHFTPSLFFRPWVEAERERRKSEGKFHFRRRRDKRLDVKIGHGGTLDPIATGVLITGVGKGTKELNTFLACSKTYEAVVLFGVATDTYDRVGRVVSRSPYEHVTREAVEKALENFRGKIMQRPPIFSALKVQGKKLYEYAREGMEPPVEILERPVEVSNLEIVEWYDGGTHNYIWPVEEAGSAEKAVAEKILAKETTTLSLQGKWERPPSSTYRQILKRKSFPLESESSPCPGLSESIDFKRQKKTSTSKTTLDLSNVSTEDTIKSALKQSSTYSAPTPSNSPPAVKLTMTVSSGFYVRCLAHDLGLALGTNAIMSSLVRTRQGDFELVPDKVLEYKDLEAGEAVWGPKVLGFLDAWVNKKGRQRGRDETEDGQG